MQWNPALSERRERYLETAARRIDEMFAIVAAAAREIPHFRRLFPAG